MSLTVKQITNFDGFPKAAELIEITGTQALEASDRAIYNHMLQIAHDSGKLTEADAEWVVTLASLRRECSGTRATTASGRACGESAAAR